MAIARSPRPKLAPYLLRLVRGAMLTPWFAVSVGIVIATTLTLARPHPALTFPPAVTGRCVKAACAKPSVSPSPPRPAIRQGVILPAPSHAANMRLAPVTVEYELLTSVRGQFTAVIQIISRHSLGRWQLKFSLPHATVADVWWAKWQSDGRGGVTVAGSPAPWSVSADHSAADQARIVVVGTGTPGWPAGCRFDGASCRFRPLPRDAAPSDIRDFGD
jgi:hypothetical protein